MIALAGTTGLIILAALFLVPGVMGPKTWENGHMAGWVGCVNLVGVPYGDNKFLNFLAWAGNAFFLPTAIIVILDVFFPSKVSKLINKYISWPVLLAEVWFISNFVRSLLGSSIFNYQSVLLALEVGLSFGLSTICFLRDRKEIKPSSWKETLYFIGFFLFVFIACLPVGTFGTLINTEVSYFGALGSSWRIVDFKFMHRMYI